MLLLYTFFFFLSPLTVFSECLVLSIETNVLNLLESWTASFFFFLFFCSVCFRGVLLLVVVSASLLQLSLLCMSLYLFFFFFACPFLSWPMICSVSSALKTRVHVGSFGSSTPTQWKEGRCCGTITITKKKKKSHFFLLLLYDANSSKWISSASENVNVVGLCHSESCDTWQRRFEREA